MFCNMLFSGLLNNNKVGLSSPRPKGTECISNKTRYILLLVSKHIFIVCFVMCVLHLCLQVHPRQCL